MRPGLYIIDMFKYLKPKDKVAESSPDELLPELQSKPIPLVKNEVQPSIFQVLVNNSEPLNSLSDCAIDERLAKFNEGLIIIELHLRDLHLEKQRRQAK